MSTEILSYLDNEIAQDANYLASGDENDATYDKKDADFQNRALKPNDLLMFPLIKSAVAQYFKDDDQPLELRIYYGTKEISFDDPEQFAFGEALVKHAEFIASDTQQWGGGDWNTVCEMLELLIEHDVISYADQNVLPEGLKNTNRASPVPLTVLSQPRTWLDDPDVMKDITGRPLEIGYLEYVVPIFRVAHPFLDADNRQIGEANVYPPALRLDCETQWRTCTYSGTRYQEEFPMNATALRVMRHHWREMMSALLEIRAYYLELMPAAREGWTVGDIERLAVMVLALPSYMLFRKEGRVANGALHPVLSSLFRVTDGLRMTAHNMLFTPFGEPTRSADTVMTAAEIYAYTERTFGFHSGRAVCAGPQFMIEDFFAVFFEGKEPRSGLADSYHPDVAEALGHLKHGFEYGMRGLQIFATIFSSWPKMISSYVDIYDRVEGWETSSSIQLTGLKEYIGPHHQWIRQTSSFLSEKNLRENRLSVYDDMFSNCVYAVTAKFPSASLSQQINDLTKGSMNLVSSLLYPFVARYFSNTADSASLVVDLNHCFSEFLCYQQAILKIALPIQHEINQLLGRKAPIVPFAGRDIDMHNILRDEPRDEFGYDFPHLIDAIESILSIRIILDADRIEILDAAATSAADQSRHSEGQMPN